MKKGRAFVKYIGMAIVLSSLLLLGGRLASLYGNSSTREEKKLGSAPKETIDMRVDSILSTLSVREKVAQLVIIEYSSKDKPEEVELQNYLVSKEKVGGIIIMNDIMLPAIKRTNELHKLAAIPLLATIDAEWGASMRYKEIPAFQRLMQMGALTNDSLVYQAGYLIGKECRQLNFHLNFAPDIDVNNNPENPVINTRSFGEDKEKVVKYASAFLRGMNDGGEYGCVKHFPGHGDTDVDSHKALPVLPFDRERLDSLELYPFKKMIEENVEMIMVGHLDIPSLDSTGTPSSISHPIITGLLREKLGYEGIVITDALNMKGICNFMDKKLIPLAAYKAGVDILLMPEDVVESISVIEQAIYSGEITVESLNDRVRKVLRMKVDLGLFDKSYNPIVDIDRIESEIVRNENKAFIDKLSKHTVTLVANDTIDGEAAVPVVSLDKRRIAYLGYDAEKFGEDCAEVLGRFAKVDKYLLKSPVSMRALRKAKRQLKRYDLVILGINNTDARPQFNFGIDSLQMKFITRWAAEQDMIALFMGSPYGLDRIPGRANFKAVVTGYANTQSNNRAAAQLIFGGIPAIGVLPVPAAGLECGESLILPRNCRMEYLYHSNDSTYRMERGRVIGNHLVAPDGDTIRYNRPFELDPQAVADIFGDDIMVGANKEYLEGFLSKMGMYSTRLIKGKGGDDGLLEVVTTLDDMSKFFYMIIRSGVYGKEQVVQENVRDRYILVIYSLMLQDGTIKIGKDGLRIAVDADTRSIKYSY